MSKRGTKRSSQEAFGTRGETINTSGRPPSSAAVKSSGSLNSTLAQRHQQRAPGKHVYFHDNANDDQDVSTWRGNAPGGQTQAAEPRLQSDVQHKHKSPQEGANTVGTNAHANMKEKARKLLETRQKLPIWGYRDAICNALRDDGGDGGKGGTDSRNPTRANNVLLIVGETGSGKSTQVPQFLAQQKWCRRRTVAVDVQDDGDGLRYGQPVSDHGETGGEPTSGGGPRGSDSTKGRAALNGKVPTPTPKRGKESAQQTKQVGGCIAITQPRRVAATSLAARVAEEMGSPLGGRRGEVGYSVRFDSNFGANTKIKFLTEGMLLVEMLRDPSLSEYSAVVVDEVHERGVGVDLCLAFLRGLVLGRRGRGGVPMRVVVMSATADMNSLSEFFDFAGGRVSCGAMDDEQGADSEPPSDGKASEVSTATTLRIPGRLYPVAINYLPSPTADIISATLDRIIYIHAHTPLPGDVLVFLPGQESIDSLLALLTTYAASLAQPTQVSNRDKNRPPQHQQKQEQQKPQLPNLLLLPLYAALPAHEQQRVFPPPPPYTRKIILATNIAETSLTVPGVRHVIDSGKSKQRLFRPTLNIDSLLTLPISRSSANQRSGRAGRDAPGTAWRLYTERDFWQEMSQDGVPEVLRCDLAQLVLTLKAHGVADLARFPMLTKPPRKGLGRALTSLLMLGALDGRTGGITHVGREMSLLPLPGNLARVLLASVGFGCVDEVVDVVAALSVENLFVNLHHASAVGEGMDDTKGEEGEGEDSISDPRLALRARLHRREGDHLTLLATVQAYVQENSDRKRWCAERGISHRAMRSVLDVRKQLSGIMARKTTRPSAAVNADGEQLSATATPTAVSSSEEPKATHSLPQSDLNTRILKCLLTGLHPNVARLAIPASSGSAAANKRKSKSSTSTSDGPPPQYLTLTTNQPVSIHPSSVLFGRRVEAVVCSEFVFTSKSYARCVSAVELGWVREAQEQAQAGTVIQS
jgi:ATP-dependent RNA helicase DHR2